MDSVAAIGLTCFAEKKNCRMEEIGVFKAAEKAGMLDRVISLRDSVVPSSMENCNRKQRK